MTRPRRLQDVIRFCANWGLVPTAFSDCPTWEEQVIWLARFLQHDVLPVVNNNAQVEEELLAWFENLDITEEVSAKLEEMAEDGRLADIIAAYIQLKGILAYNTVAEMKLAENLVNGSFAETYGFYANGDGGSAKYKVREVTNSDVIDEMTIIALNDDQLVAELIISPEMYVEQFGAQGAEDTDDQDSINAALNSGASVVKLQKGKTYNVRGYETGQPEGSGMAELSAQTGIVVPSNTTFDLNNATIKVIANGRKNYNAITLQDVENVIVKNGTIIGDVIDHTGADGEWGYGISLRKTHNIVIENMYITLMWGDGINLKSYSTDNRGKNDNVLIRNVECYDNRRQGMSVEHASDLTVENSKFNNTGATAHTNPTCGVDIEPSSGEFVTNVKFNSCEFNENYNVGMDINAVNIDGVVINNCQMIDNLSTSSGSIFTIAKGKNVSVIDCEITNNGESVKSVNLKSGNSLTLQGNKFKNAICLINAIDTFDKCYVKFVNNTFILTVSNQWNGVIETTTSSQAVSGNEIVLENNSFLNKSGTDTNNISTWIKSFEDSKFAKISCIGNYFEGGQYAIRTKGVSVIVRNCDFVKQYSFPITLENGTDTSIYYEFTENTFEQASWNTANAGTIWNRAETNIVAGNNVIFDDCLNAAISATATNTTSRMLQTITGAGSRVEYNNNVIHN